MPSPSRRIHPARWTAAPDESGGSDVPTAIEIASPLTGGTDDRDNGPVMAVIPYTPAMSDDVQSAYNIAIRDVPHCYPVDDAELAPVLAGGTGMGQGHDDLRAEAILVARRGRSVVGFIHVGVGHEPDASSRDVHQADRGIIRFFWYARGYRAAGQALLDAAHEHFRREGMNRVEAFHNHFRYPFYHLNHAYLSDRLDHVRALLQFNRYALFQGEVFFDWADYPPPDPAASDVPVEISLDWPQKGGDKPSLVVRAHRDDEQIGECVCDSCAEFSRNAAARDWLFVNWLGVNDEYQAKGLGRHLLQRALKEMHAVGYRHAAISTDWKNYRAFVFYSNYGFRVVDWTYGLAREL